PFTMERRDISLGSACQPVSQRRNSRRAPRSWRSPDTRRRFRASIAGAQNGVSVRLQTGFQEESMSRFVGFARRALACAVFFAVALFLAGIAGWSWPPSARPGQEAAKSSDDASLLEGFRHVEAASVSDALEQISGRKMYMSHRMRPIFPTKFAGLAVTVLLKKESNHDPDALKGMLAAIDSGAPNSIYVMVVEDGADIAGMGGLMGTAMSSRNFSGAVIDGGVRDVAYLTK